MGMKIKAAGTSFPTSRPIIKKYDPLETAGSLVLFDVANPAQDFTLAAENSGETEVVNLMAERASVVTGSASSLCNITQDRKSEQTAGSDIASSLDIEITPKGGIHVMYPQSLSLTSLEDYFTLLSTPSSAIQNYIDSNSGTSGILPGDRHNFYVSTWQRCTRGAVNSGTYTRPWITYGDPNDYLFQWQGNLGYPRPTSITDYYRSPLWDFKANPNVNTPLYADFAVDGPWTVGDGDGENQPVYWAITGHGPFANSEGGWITGSRNVAESRIIYRIYVEDLTESGRTYAEVSALDRALFTEAFSVGGVFYGDTWSDPVTTNP